MTLRTACLRTRIQTRRKSGFPLTVTPRRREKPGENRGQTGPRYFSAIFPEQDVHFECILPQWPSKPSSIAWCGVPRDAAGRGSPRDIFLRPRSGHDRHTYLDLLRRNLADTKVRGDRCQPEVRQFFGGGGNGNNGNCAAFPSGRSCPFDGLPSRAFQ